jgi:LmbE family N-acetylglucosaminyl deacetylase
VPYRLLGLTAHPDQAGHLCGQAFARYTATGAHATLVCAAGHGCDATAARATGRRLGLTNLVLLDDRPGEMEAADLESLFADVMTSFRPHVVVADRAQPIVWEAARAAFDRVRRRVGGSAALPAKLYYRATDGLDAVPVTTAVSTPSGGAPELFVRVCPSPWLTGVLERDLFAGVPMNPVASTDLADRLVS